MVSDFELIKSNTTLIEKVIKSCENLALTVVANVDTLRRLTETIKVLETRIARLESKSRLKEFL